MYLGGVEGGGKMIKVQWMMYEILQELIKYVKEIKTCRISAKIPNWAGSIH